MCFCFIYDAVLVYYLYSSISYPSTWLVDYRAAARDESFVLWLYLEASASPRAGTPIVWKAKERERLHERLQHNWLQQPCTAGWTVIHIWLMLK